MIDPKKLPRLQPKFAQQQNVLPDDSPIKQILGVFSGVKGFALACFIAVCIYASICVQQERLLREGVYEMFKALGDEGFGVSYNISSSYSALKSGLNLDDVIITAPEKLGSWSLKAGRITVSANPFTHDTVVIEANGTHSLMTKTIGDIRLVVGSGEIQITSPAKSPAFSLQASFKNIQSAAPASMDGFAIGDLTLSVNRADTGSDTVAAPTFVLQSNGIILPAFLARDLPPKAEYVRLAGTLTTAQPSDTQQPLLTGWINGGGTAEIAQGEIIWQPFMTTFSGTFGLNNSFELIGSSVAKVYGLFDLLDMMQKAGYARSSHVSVAKVVLGAELKTQSGETRPSLTSPFSIQSGRIYAGSILLYDRHGEHTPNIP